MTGKPVPTRKCQKEELSDQEGGDFMIHALTLLALAYALDDRRLEQFRDRHVVGYTALIARVF